MMKITVFCVLLVLGLGHCQDNDVPALSEIENSINRTIEEVERMVKDNPKLPRLSRQEIVNILYNITSKDIDALKDQKKIEKARSLYQRALMVVLPYNTKDTSESLKDLFTKPPMTQIVPDLDDLDEIKPDDPMEHREEKDPSTLSDVPEENLASSTVASTQNLSTSTTTETIETTRSTQKEIPVTTSKYRYKNHRETYTDIHRKAPLKETLKRDSAPVRFSFNLDNLQKKNADKVPITTRRPVFRKELYERKPQNNSKLEIVYSTSSSTEPSTTASKPEELEPTKEPELKNDQNILSSDQWKYNAPPRTSNRPTTSRPTTSRPRINRFRGKPMTQTTEEMMSTTQHSEIMKKTPKTTMKPIRVASTSTSNSFVYVTPMSSESAPKLTSPKYSSSYSASASGSRTTTPKPMRPEVMDLLASIGLHPENTSQVEEEYKKHQDILGSKLRIPETNNVVYTTTSGLSTVGSDSPSILTQNTFEGAGSEIQKGVQNLTPEVQLLFEKFGLQTSNIATTTTTTTPKTVTRNSYTNFKPLPTSSVRDVEMREFLAKFGLGVADIRKEKAMKPTTKRPSLAEAVPDNMRNVLENIGLISNSRKKLLTKEKTAEATEAKHHVFKPHEVNYGDEQQRVKINELLDTVKMVQQGRGKIEDVQKAAKDLLQTTKTLKDGPDPLSLEEIIRIYNDDLKNEVKRQQQETTTETQTEEKSPSPIPTGEPTSTGDPGAEDSAGLATGVMDSSTTPTDQLGQTSATSSPNLKDLEDSFGGTTAAPDPVLPTKPKTGLYFLVDWNTFLEVGEEEREKVNLRFQPKVGDRTRFLSVSVP